MHQQIRTEKRHSQGLAQALAQGLQITLPARGCDCPWLLLVVMACPRVGVSPPGLDAKGAPESATASRERRRVALAVRTALEEVGSCIDSRFDALEASLHRIEQQIGGSPLPRQGDEEEPNGNAAMNEFYGISLRNVGVQNVEGDFVGTWLPLASVALEAAIPGRGKRQLRVNISDASTAATEARIPDPVPPMQSSSWQRLAEDVLAQSRLVSIRAMAAAPASGSAMVSRMRSPEEDDDDEEDDEQGPSVETATKDAATAAALCEDSFEAGVEAETAALTDELLALSDELARLAKAKAHGDFGAGHRAGGLLAAPPNELG